MCYLAGNSQTAPTIFSYFQHTFLQYLNPKTTIALTFFTHDISGIVGVLCTQTLWSGNGMHRDAIFHPNSFLRYMQNNVENITPERACNMHQNSFVQIWVHRTSFFLPLCFAAVI